MNPKAPNFEDQMAQKNYNIKVEYKKIQYWVSLPWKINSPLLPTNYVNTKGQLMHMWNK